MKKSINRPGCPEYHFVFGPHGMERIVPTMPSCTHNFWGQEFFIEHKRLAASFACQIPPRYGDWLELAVAVYLADRFAPRRDLRFRSDLVHRRRKLRIQLPVQDLSFWRANQTQQLLQNVLWRLTEDSWEFEFVKSATVLHSCAQPYLFGRPLNAPARVALFSGGLDAFAGAALQIQDAASTHVFVSGVTHGRMELGQRRQLDILQDNTIAEVRHVQVGYGLKEKKVHENALERSQRTRAFVHVTLGAIAALLAGSHEFLMYENGYGALNLPFDATQVGIETSKAANPVFHRLMEKLIGWISGGSFQIVNPFQFLTKAQALKKAAVRRFSGVLVETFSCDRFPNWREGRSQCGICASGILRRLSLEAAGLSDCDHGTRYARDVKSELFTPGDSAASVLSHYDVQASSIEKALANANPWLALATDFPELYEAKGALSSGDAAEEGIRQSLLSLLKAHIVEWRNFSGRAALDRYLLAA